VLDLSRHSYRFVTARIYSSSRGQEDEDDVRKEEKKKTMEYSECRGID